ncbi:ectoine/hydroxyectoine ABC transporter permease subunit EhuC [Paenibacillus sepulcri]|uniref:Ectoine/hydroxyectoine ABC transporter permease subunit EhuC n=1 Tax=Paenibacillus sepulcri TaxID=359917 RepID=A0ABS7C061_9BACL|nr:ectoine/hydroxyectoine ABC transporter permease subunit EhuC [Paenibacillus sepulcri]
MTPTWSAMFPLLYEGVKITIQVTVMAGIVALIVSVAAGLGRVSSYAVVRGISRIYVDLFRASSLLVLMFWIYFALPFAGIELSKMVTAVLAIGLNCGAYGSEIVRSSILAVPSGQYEASLALNLTPRQRMWRVVIPQAVVRMLPPFGNLLIELLKSTSLVYFITLSDLTYEAMILRNNYLSWTPQIFGLLLVIYFALSACITVTIRLLERKFAAWR